MFSVTYGIAVVLDVLQRMKVGESSWVYFKKNLELHIQGCYEGNGCLTGLGGGRGGVEGFFTCI